MTSQLVPLIAGGSLNALTWLSFTFLFALELTVVFGATLPVYHLFICAAALVLPCVLALLLKQTRLARGGPLAYFARGQAMRRARPESAGSLHAIELWMLASALPFPCAHWPRDGRAPNEKF